MIQWIEISSDDDDDAPSSDLEILEPPSLTRPARITAPTPRQPEPESDDPNPPRPISGFSVPSSQRERGRVFEFDKLHPPHERASFRPYPPGPDGLPHATRAHLAAEIAGVGPDEPLPKPRWSFVPEEYEGTAFPSKSAEVLARLGGPDEDEVDRKKQAEWEARWDDEWRKAKVMPGPAVPWEWKLVSSTNTTRSPSRRKQFSLRGVEFFPWADLPGCADLTLAFAVIGGGKVWLYKLDPNRVGATEASSSTSGSAPIVGKLAESIELTRTDPQDQEKPGKHGKGNKKQLEDKPEVLCACAWGLDQKYKPPVPLIFVAGEGKLVHVLQVLKDPATAGRYKLVLERSISGQGRTIYALAVIPREPNLVIAAGDDGAPGLYDATVAGGSNKETLIAYSKSRAASTSAGKASSKKAAPPLKLQDHIIRPFVQGELLGKFTARGAGHLKGVLSVAVHPVADLVVTGGLDGRVIIWQLPKNLHRVHLKEFDKILFRSHRVHSGQWVDQVAWANSNSFSIISKSACSNADSPHFRSKMLLHWTPIVLDHAVNDEDHSSDEALRPPNGELAYHLEQRAEWPDQNVVGDRCGSYHVFAAPGVLEEPLIAVPIGPRPRLTDPVSVPPAVAVMSPFSGRRVVLPNGSAPWSDEEIVQALFPADRERPINDFTPRWMVEDWVDLEPGQEDERAKGSSDGGGKEAGAQAEARLRALAVSCDGGWMVGVGYNKLLVAWKRVARAKAEVKLEE